MSEIPEKVHSPINGDSFERVCVIGTIGANGYAQLSPRGSLMVFDKNHLAIWERSGDRQNGTKITVYFRAREGLKSVVPGGVVRFYGTAEVHRSGPVYEKVWERLIPVEKQGDPSKKGYAVLIKIDRAEDLLRNPLK